MQGQNPQGQSNQRNNPFTLVFYYVPEDKDELATPNAFIINRDMDDITLNDIKTGFPLEGDFFFRFKYRYNNASVWLDLSNHKCPVPKFDGKIIIKVTRTVPKNTVFEELGASPAEVQQKSSIE